MISHWSEKGKKKKKGKTTYQKEVRSDGDSQTGIVYNYGSIGHRIRDERSRNGGHSSTKNRRASWKFESRKYSSSFLWLSPLNSLILFMKFLNLYIRTDVSLFFFSCFGASNSDWCKPLNCCKKIWCPNFFWVWLLDFLLSMNPVRA